MKVLFLSSQKASSGVAIVPVFLKQSLVGAASSYDADSLGQLTAAMKAAHFKGNPKDALTIFAPAGSELSGIHLRGGGIREDWNAELFGAEALGAFRATGEKTLTLHLEGVDLADEDAVRAAYGACLAAYRFDKYRTKLPSKSETTVTKLQVCVDDPAAAKKLYQKFYGPVCEGQLMARDLVNEPSNTLYPKAYADRIKKFEKLGIEVEVLGEKKMTQLGMGALLGVGLASPHESQLVVMRWNGGKKADKPVCLVGKGVTFDTGGISLKAGAGMWDMKADMGGSAAVVGAMHALASRKAKVNVVGIVGLVENMPDGLAQNPGDIVTSMSGQTIEVQNTDAEGRLVLADALWYAKETYKPCAMVDLATLTGAIVVALGEEQAGLFTNSDDLANAFASASQSSSEKTWRLPLAPEYDRLLDSPNADMKNIGGREGGSITAAQFLQRFVGDTPWVHLDIAGVAAKNKRKDPREVSFATGFGVRLLNQWIRENYEG